MPEFDYGEPKHGRGLSPTPERLDWIFSQSSDYWDDQQLYLGTDDPPSKFELLVACSEQTGRFYVQLYAPGHGRHQVVVDESLTEGEDYFWAGGERHVYDAGRFVPGVVACSVAKQLLRNPASRSLPSGFRWLDE